MKKIVKISSLSLMLGALMFSAISVTLKKEPERTFALTPAISQAYYLPEDVTRYIPMAKESFANWNDCYGGYTEEDQNRFFQDTNATYWEQGYTFFNKDTMYRGEVNEGRKELYLKTKAWKQYTPYIYFQWGGARDTFRDVNPVKLIFRAWNDGGEVSSWEHFNDTFCENAMVLRHFEVPADIYEGLDKTNGFNMEIELFDNRENDYGFHNFGYLNVNQTKEEVATAYRNYVKDILTDNRNHTVDMRYRIVKSYSYNGYLNNMFRSLEVEKVYGDFDNIADFYANWYFDPSYHDRAGLDDGWFHFDRAISTNGDVRPHDRLMPFNKDGAGFFRGWFETKDGLNEGFVDSDAPKYRFKSFPVTLHENHLVSIKMAGTAALQVFDASTDEMIKEVNSSVHNPSGDQWIHEGFNTCTMIRQVIDLSEFASRKVYFAIADNNFHANWQAAYFDSFDSDYNPTSKGINVDIINQDGNISVHADRYLQPNNEVFNADYKAAHAFVTEYYNIARNGQEGRSFCYGDKENSTQIRELLTVYLNLSSNAQSIVNASEDYQRVVGNIENDIPDVRSECREANLGEAINYLLVINNMGGVGNKLGFSFIQSEANGGFVLPTVAAIIVVLLATIIIIKKRKSFVK